MTRVGALRAGYAVLAVAFAAFAGAHYLGALLLLGLVLALVGGIVLAFSDDDLPKWSGIAVIAYFLLTALAFFATTPITIDRGGSSYYFAPPDLTTLVLYWMGLLSPLVLAGAGLVASWERERPPRALLVGALLGFALVATLSATLQPDLDPKCAADPDAEGCAGAAAAAAAQAQQQSSLIAILFALSGACGAAGCAWAALRPQEID